MFSAKNYGGIVTKTKAIYGKRIKPSDYEALANMKTVPQIAKYIMSHEGYKDAFPETGNKENKTSYIEGKLKAELEKEFMRVLKFANGDDHRLLEAIYTRLEIDEMLYFLRKLVSERTDSYEPRISEAFRQRSKINFNAFKEAKTFQDFMEVIKNSKYYEPLVRFLPVGKFDYTEVENVLSSLYYAEVLKRIEKYAPKNDVAILQDFIGGLVDLTNFFRIIRCKRYHKLDGELIYANLLPLTYKLDKKIIADMVDAPNWNDAYNIIYSTKYKKLFEQAEYEYVEEYLQEFAWDCASKILHGNNATITMPFAYFYAKNIEIKNLTNIIECVRYGVDSKDIKRHLIGIKDGEK